MIFLAQNGVLLVLWEQSDACAVLTGALAEASGPGTAPDGKGTGGQHGPLSLGLGVKEVCLV